MHHENLPKTLKNRYFSRDERAPQHGVKKRGYACASFATLWNRPACAPPF
jgi:hypothetical protein